MTIKELRKYIALAVRNRRYGIDDPVIYAVDELDYIDFDCKLNGAKYAVYIEQAYNTYPIPAHWLPVPKKFNSIIESYGIY